MSAYFVVTALTTVRPVTAWTRWVNAGALAVVVVLALGSLDKGVKAFGSPAGVLNGVPFFMLFFIGTVMAIAAAGDVRVMWSGPREAAPGSRGTCGACASHSLSRPDRSFRSRRVSRGSFRNSSRDRKSVV